MVEMSTEMNKRVLVRPASDLLCSILAVASSVHYMVRAYLWELANELDNAEIKCTESDEAKETVQSTFDINQYVLMLYYVAREVTPIYPYDLDPKSHTGVQLAMNTRWFNSDLRTDFNETMGRLFKLAEWLLRTNWPVYLQRAKDMHQDPVQHREELLQVYPYYFDKEGRKRNNIPDPEPHTIAPLLVIRDLLGPLNSRGLFAGLIVEVSDLDDKDKEEHIESLEKGGWTSGTNASMATLRVHETDPCTVGNYRSEPHEPHGKVVPSATAA